MKTLRFLVIAYKGIRGFVLSKKKHSINLNLIAFLFIILVSQNVFSQQRNINGSVLDAETTQPLPGASVLVKGTLKGTTTDFDGNFSIDGVSKGDILVVSFVGYTTQEIVIEDLNSITVNLNVDISSLDEIVVTALGIKKEVKAVGYAVQEVKGETMVKAREPNIINSLTGKVAGLNISNSTDLFQDPSISLRGARPLIVIDGIPSTDSDFWKVNADDIEDITVLKGAAASALYGTIGRNGAMMITTKRGKEGKVSIDYNVSVMFQPSYIRIPKVQTTYGNGDNGNYEYVNGRSGASEGGWIWGPKLDQPDPSTPSGFWETKQFNSPIDPNTGERIPIPYISRGKNNLENFFETGMIITNNLSASGGTDKGNFRVSASHVYQKGLVPNTDLKNANFTVSGGYNITDKLKADASLTYNRQYTRNFPETGYGSQNYLYNLVLWMGSDVDVRDLKNYWEEGKEGVQQRHYNLAWYNNPYFNAYEALRGYYKDNSYGQLSLKYDILKDFNITLRTGVNSANVNRDWKYPKSFVSIPAGEYSVANSNSLNINTDIIVNYSKEINDNFNLSVNAGVANRYGEFRSASSSTDGLTIPNYYNLSNSTNPTSSSNSYSESQTNSVYASIDMEVYKSFFINVSGRNDWVSTLPVVNNSFFYPSLSLSVVLSDILDFNANSPYIKLRTSWASVGNGNVGGTYAHLQAYSSGPIWNNQNSLVFPGTLINPLLEPGRSDTNEYGLDVRFFKSRLNLDFTYYNIRDYNNILSEPLSIASGYSSRLINGGEFKREGFEFTLSATPIKTDNFRWNILTNWSKSYRILSKTADGSDSNGNIKVGTRTDQIYTRPYLKTPGGALIYGSNGLPLNDPFVRKRGNNDPDWVYGFQNTFTYKNFSLSASVDGRIGGLIYSSTNQKMWWGGTHPGTVNEHRDAANDGQATYIGPGVVVVDGSVEYDDVGNIINDTRVYAPNTRKVNYISWNKSTSNALLDHYYDETFLKLREIILTYNVPNSITEKLKIDKASISLIGRNLAVWSDLPNVDPDPGFDSLQTPSTRNIGVNVNLSF